jgi:hypothetical protein
MKTFHQLLPLVTVVLAAFAQQAAAQTLSTTSTSTTLTTTAFIPPGLQPSLVGTIGDCHNRIPGGPCTQNSTLVLLDPNTGALIRTIGPVGFTVNGLAWDRTTKTLFATTAIGCGLPGSVCPFHGLITIAPNGKGTPVNLAAVNFGIEGGDVGVSKLAIDVFGHLVASYPIPPPPTDDVDNTYVRIDPKTGIATEHPNTGINTARDGLSFGEFNLLWDVDDLNSTAFLLNPFTGKSLFAQPINPPTMAALGDFNSVDNLYYGLSFTSFDPTGATAINVIDVPNGTVVRSMPTVNFLHVITWVDKK